MIKPDHTTPTARRRLIGALGITSATPLAAVATGPSRPVAEGPAADPGADALRARRAPDVPLLDHNGRRVRFYRDVMKNRRVVLNVMYSVCSNVCSPATRNLIEARQLLGEQARALQFVSITLTPLSDPPEALRAYRQRHGIADDWLFLTGEVASVERVQRALGFIGTEPDDDLLSHSAMARYCDERLHRWTHLSTLAPPRSIARMIRFEMA